MLRVLRVEITVYLCSNECNTNVTRDVTRCYACVTRCFTLHKQQTVRNQGKKCYEQTDYEKTAIN